MLFRSTVLEKMAFFVAMVAFLPKCLAPLGRVTGATVGTVA